MKLYEIDAQIMQCINMETGEILDEDLLNMLNIERDKKIESIALMIKNLSAEAEALNKEKNAFAEREKAAKTTVERLKKWLSDSLSGEKFKTEKVAISFRKSASVNCDEGAEIPDEYKKITVEADKAGIKKALQSGVEIPGWYIENKQNIQIK